MVLPKIAVTDTTLVGSDVPGGVSCFVFAQIKTSIDLRLDNIATQNLTIHRDPQAFRKSG